jgi:hypothetical protein
MLAARGKELPSEESAEAGRESELGCLSTEPGRENLARSTNQ